MGNMLYSVGNVPGNITRLHCSFHGGSRQPEKSLCLGNSSCRTLSLGNQLLFWQRISSISDLDLFVSKLFFLFGILAKHRRSKRNNTHGLCIYLLNTAMEAKRPKIDLIEVFRNSDLKNFGEQFHSFHEGRYRDLLAQRPSMPAEELSDIFVEELQKLLKLVKDPTAMSSLPQKTYDELSFSQYHILDFDVRTTSSDSSSSMAHYCILRQGRRPTDDILNCWQDIIGWSYMYHKMPFVATKHHAAIRDTPGSLCQNVSCRPPIRRQFDRLDRV